MMEENQQGMRNPVEAICVYESRSVLVLVGRCSKSMKFLVLEVKRPTILTDDTRFEARLHPHTYTQDEVDELTANAKMTKIVTNALFIFGFVKLIESYYLILVTKATPVASMHGHTIYTIADTTMIPITYKARNTMEETRYKDILTGIGLNLRNDGYFFSSSSYDLTRTFEQNMGPSKKQSFPRDIYVWNHYALLPLIQAALAHPSSSQPLTEESNQDEMDDVASVHIQRWIVPVIHGTCQLIPSLSRSCPLFLTSSPSSTLPLLSLTPPSFHSLPPPPCSQDFYVRRPYVLLVPRAMIIPTIFSSSHSLHGGDGMLPRIYLLSTPCQLPSQYTLSTQPPNTHPQYIPHPLPPSQPLLNLTIPSPSLFFPPLTPPSPPPLLLRSRVFAGTRYLRRGVDHQGYTANEVETEQILTYDVPGKLP